MSLRRPILLRTVGFVALVGLVGLNGWLILLNLAKHDRLPAVFDDVPGLVAMDAEPDPTPEAAQVMVREGETRSFNAAGGAATEVTGPGTIEVDQWPGGRGPAPDGPPVRRQVLVTPDGGLRVIGSAPSWSVATELAGAIGRRLGRDPASIDLEVSWHPEASDRLAEGDVVLEQRLRYPAGQIERTAQDGGALDPVVELLAEDAALYVLVVGLVGEGETSDGAAAVALGRTSVVAEDLVAAGIDPDRVVTLLARADAGVSADRSGGEVVVRIENLLVFGPAG